jgi:hypothetical protein
MQSSRNLTGDSGENLRLTTPQFFSTALHGIPHPETLAACGKIQMLPGTVAIED